MKKTENSVGTVPSDQYQISKEGPRFEIQHENVLKCHSRAFYKQCSVFFSVSLCFFFVSVCSNTLWNGGNLIDAYFVSFQHAALSFSLLNSYFIYWHEILQCLLPKENTRTDSATRINDA